MRERAHRYSPDSPVGINCPPVAIYSHKSDSYPQSMSFYRDMVPPEFQNDLGDVSAFFSPSSREDEVWVGAKFFHKIYVFLTRGG